MNAVAHAYLTAKTAHEAASKEFNAKFDAMFDSLTDLRDSGRITVDEYNVRMESEGESIINATHLHDTDDALTAAETALLEWGRSTASTLAPKQADMLNALYAGRHNARDHFKLVDATLRLASI
jgi:hypothetical protein